MYKKTSAKSDDANIAKFLSATVSEVTGRRRAGFLYGVELEQEGPNVNNVQAPPGWAPHNDGSLRPTHGGAIEWVFSSPVTLGTAEKRIDVLFNAMEAAGARCVESNRTSTHVHMNFADKQIYQVVNFVVAFAVFEDILGRYCGDERNGNLFCLPLRRAENILETLDTAIRRWQNFNDFGDRMKYAGLNLATLNNYGSLEVRLMRGLGNAADVKTWLYMMSDLYHFSCEQMFDPTTFIADVSYLGPEALLRRVWRPELAELLLASIPADELYSSVYGGLRAVQMLAYNIAPAMAKVKKAVPDFWDEQVKPEVREEEAEIAQEEPAPRRRVDWQEMAVEMQAAPVRTTHPWGQVPPWPPVDDPFPAVNHDAFLRALGRDNPVVGEL